MQHALSAALYEATFVATPRSRISFNSPRAASTSPAPAHALIVALKVAVLGVISSVVLLRLSSISRRRLMASYGWGQWLKVESDGRIRGHERGMERGGGREEGGDQRKAGAC